MVKPNSVLVTDQDGQVVLMACEEVTEWEENSDQDLDTVPMEWEQNSYQVLDTVLME